MGSVADHGCPHACSRRWSWSRANVENEVDLRCQKLPERTLATPCKLAKMSSVTWQLIAIRRLYHTKTMIRHVHFIWSTANRYNILDATMTVKSSHVLQPQWMINASGCDAQLEQHRTVHLIDETYCSCVSFGLSCGSLRARSSRF